MEVNFNPAKIKLVIGLGNPDKEYQDTYHNAGHLFIDYLKTHSLQPTTYNLKTDCFMNQSGNFVTSAAKKKNAKPEEVLVVHDDSDLNLGEFKVDFGRGSAGHKGVESIIKAFGTKGFWRLRIGIRPTGFFSRFRGRRKAGDFVLNKISPGNKKTLERVFGEAAALIINNH